MLIRHGQTDWNKEERFRGRTDIELNETGLKQALAAGNALCQLDIGAIYTSPLKRAQKTAAVIADCTGKPLLIADELIDIDFGQFQGLTAAEAAARDKALWQMWVDSPHQVHFPEGESLPIVETRINLAIDKAREYGDRTVVMVSHSVVCKVMVCHIVGLDLSHFWQIDQATGAITVFETRNNMLVASKINDTCHLKAV